MSSLIWSTLREYWRHVPENSRTLALFCTVIAPVRFSDFHRISLKIDERQRFSAKFDEIRPLCWNRLKATATHSRTTGTSIMHEAVTGLPCGPTRGCVHFREQCGRWGFCPHLSHFRKFCIALHRFSSDSIDFRGFIDFQTCTKKTRIHITD